MQLATQRLLIRDWQPDIDAAEAIAIYGNPQVTQWIGDKSLDNTVEAVQARLQRYCDRAATFPGLGCWAVVQQDTQAIIGTLLLMPLPGQDNQPSGKVEIGWHFRPESWGYGYATEAAYAVLKMGFTTLDLPTIYAVALLENDRSLRVMQRLNMADLGVSHDYYGGHPLRLFCRHRFEVPIQAPI
ncbi:MAG: GNAT family N-acetyltransferase [Leptolyngbya sp. SIOISBB]|nr:GNAT family N-acetyltransferase [Leptolyngbya sp. SIOISBB]